MVVVGTFDGVTILKSDVGGWVNLIKEGAVTYRAQLLLDEVDRLVVVFKQKAPESKVCGFTITMYVMYKQWWYKIVLARWEFLSSPTLVLITRTQSVTNL